MSWGVGVRNAIGLGLGGIIALFSGYARDQEFNNLATEADDNLVQEDGGFILV
jgi:hydrogenase/urease accessory protein HupE